MFALFDIHYPILYWNNSINKTVPSILALVKYSVLVQVFSSMYFRNISIFSVGSYGQIARLEKETFLIAAPNIKALFVPQSF